MLLTGIESAATHVSDQVQPASSVSKLQAPGKPTESTFIAGDPVTECVIHYSLICNRYPHPRTYPTTSPIQPWGETPQPDQIHRLAYLWRNRRWPSYLPDAAFVSRGVFAAQWRGNISASSQSHQYSATPLCVKSETGKVLDTKTLESNEVLLSKVTDMEKR